MILLFGLQRKKITNIFLNPFIPNAPFLYSLKTSENLRVCWCFEGVEKGCIGNEWVKETKSGNSSCGSPYPLRQEFLIYFWNKTFHLGMEECTRKLFYWSRNNKRITTSHVNLGIISATYNYHFTFSIYYQP